MKKFQNDHAEDAAENWGKKVLMPADLATRLEHYVKGKGGIENVDPDEFLMTLEISAHAASGKLTRQDLHHTTLVRAKRMFDEMVEDMSGLDTTTRASVAQMITDLEEEQLGHNLDDGQMVTQQEETHGWFSSGRE